MYEPLPVSLSCVTGERAQLDVANGALAFTPTSAASVTRHHSIITRMGLISLSDVLTFQNAVWVEPLQPGPDYPPCLSENGGHHAGSSFSFCLMKSWKLRLPALLLPAGPKASEGSAFSRMAAC